MSLVKFPPHIDPGPKLRPRIRSLVDVRPYWRRPGNDRKTRTEDQRGKPQDTIHHVVQKRRVRTKTFLFSQPKQGV